MSEIREVLARIISAAQASWAGGRTSIAKRREPVVYQMADHRSWGHTIEWFRDPDKKGVGNVVGWMGRRQPEVGDWIVSAMQSRREVFEVTSKECMRDPGDMFFADVRFKGYWDELGRHDA